MRDDDERPTPDDADWWQAEQDAERAWLAADPAPPPWPPSPEPDGYCYEADGSPYF